jgi:hypothetical protein
VLEEYVMRSLFLGLLVFAAAALLNTTAGQAQTPRATITFENGSGQDALVKVLGPTNRSTAVPNGESRTVTVLGGEYYILTRYGPYSDGHYTYSKGDPFQVTQTSTQYSVITITLQKVDNGNYSTEPVSADEFDKQ